MDSGLWKFVYCTSGVCIIKFIETHKLRGTLLRRADVRESVRNFVKERFLCWGVMTITKNRVKPCDTAPSRQTPRI